MAFVLGLALVLLRGKGGGVVAPVGKKQRAKTREARARLPNLSRYYKGALREIEPGEFEFSATLLRGIGRKAIALDEYAEEIEWADEGPVLTGTVSLRREPSRPREIPILGGHRIRLRVRYRNSWHTLWTMRCAAPQVSLGEATITVELSDDLDALNRNRRDWSFRRTKKHPKGYRAHEIAREVARREGLRVRALARGKYRMKKLVRKNTRGLVVIGEAYRFERRKTGTRFIVRLTDGELEVVPFRRNRILYVFREQIQEALLTAEQRAHPVTVIDAKGRVGKGKDAKKVSRRVYHRAVVRRYGWVAKEKNYGRVDSAADLAREARRDLAKAIRVRRTADLTVPGVPFLRRGDGIRWGNREPGWYGKEVEHSRDRTYVYVRAIRHSVSSGGYTTSMTVVQDDPFRKDRERQDEEARDRAKKRRKARRK